MMAPVFPDIEASKSSLEAAEHIYSPADFPGRGNSRQKKKKSRRESRERLTSSPVHGNQKLLRKKEYSSQLKMRKERVQSIRENNIDRIRRRSELQEVGFQEKERINILFNIYAAQQGSAYRKPAQIRRPHFPDLLKPSSHLAPKISSHSKEFVLPTLVPSSIRSPKTSVNRN